MSYLVIYRFPEIDWQEATLSNVTGKAIVLAREYLRIIERIERGGANAAELDEQRQEAHDALIFELQACGIHGVGVGFDERENARQLAIKIDRWIRED